MHILFIILPYQSHLLAVFDSAKKYKNENKKVIFTGEVKHKELIEREGFIFEQFSYVEEYKVVNLKVFFAFTIQSILGKRLKIERYKTLYNTRIELYSLMKKHSIHRVFIDEYISDYYFLFRNNVDVSIVNTRPSTKKVKGVPPLNSLFTPTGGVISNLTSEWLWFRHLAKRKNTETINFIAFWGVDEKFLLNRIAKKNGKNYYKEICNQHCLNPSIKNVLTYNLSPEYFEFPFRKRQENEEFVFEEIVRNEESYFTEEYEFLKQNIINEKREDKKIIYLSFGTINHNISRDVFSFLDELCNICASNPQVVLVISNKAYKPKRTSNNVQTFNFLPQIDFLNYVDLMINHGGMGSIKECLQANVKMLSYPLNPNTDQRGNAVRVEALGFGLKGDIKKDSKAEIERKIKQLLDI